MLSLELFYLQNFTFTEARTGKYEEQDGQIQIPLQCNAAIQ